MSKNVTKSVAGIIANVSSNMTVSLALRTILPPQLSLIQKVCTEVGLVTIGGMVGRSAENYAHDLIDDTYAIFNK